ncbi:MAG: PIN domain-containing protein [Bauldia sp.]
MKAALDTNILAYAEGVNGEKRRDGALDLLSGLPPDSTVIPVQVLGELFNLLVRKAGRSRQRARDAVLSWHDAYPVVETTAPIMMVAADLATVHRLELWDAVVLSAAAAAGCRLVLSEDLQDGFTWSGVTVANPFARVPHRLLASFRNPTK